MPSTVLCSVIFLACALTLSAAQTTCKGRCGGEYYRGYTCQCDYTCMSYGECCKDYESQCTTANSCQGRCGETFKRGRLCNCDPDCVKYNQCCSDYKTHCDEEEEINGAESVSAPCNNVKDNKPKDPSLYEATEDPFIEDDDSFPEASPSPQDDLSDDLSSQTYPSEELSDNGPEDPEESPTTDPADPLDQVATEATLLTDALELSTETVTDSPDTSPSDIEPTQADDDSPTESADVSDPEMPTTSPDSETTLPPSSTSVEQDSSQPASTSVPEIEPEPTDNIPELVGTDGQAEHTDSTEASTTTTSSPPVTSESAELTKDSSTTSEDVPDSTTPASTTLDPTPIPEATTSSKEPDVTELDSKDATTGPSSSLPDPQDPSTDVSPVPELDSPTTHAPSLTDAAKEDTSDDVTPEQTTADSLKVTPEATTKPQVKPDPYKPQPTKPTLAKPTSKQPETKPLDSLNTDNPRDFQGDDSNDTNLCSGRPVSAVTTLKNGTVVVFRGHYFWFLDRNKVPGPARGITEVWGVPSPIDTSFTRCNCQGKTYIFKGPRYWRFENDVLDPGYPQAIQTGFDGLRGQVTAALSVPQHRSRREAVYFFKRGGAVQKYTYQFGTSPTCGKKVQYTIHTVRNRLARQAVSFLGPTINIRKTWKGFPSTITAALSVPTTREPEGYKYYVFSRAKSYNIRIDGERPVVAPPKPKAPPQSNEVFKCPKKV